MKSNRARKYLDDRYKTMFLMSLSESINAVEIAEEDMAEKATKAFCSAHCPKGCPSDDKEECGALLDFKQKMEE